jgi:hypothetical protein
MSLSNFNLNSLYEFKISEYVGEEYLPFIEDIVRMVILQITINFMYFTKDPSQSPFFTMDFIELVLYVCMGVAVYWLIFKSLIQLS